MLWIGTEEPQGESFQALLWKVKKWEKHGGDQYDTENNGLKITKEVVKVTAEQASHWIQNTLT